MKKIIVTMLLISGVASAAVVTQTETFSGTPSFNRALTFNQFDDNDGAYTLDSVTVRLYLTTSAGAQLDVDNDGELATEGTASFGSLGSLSSVHVFLGGDAAVSTLTTKYMTLAGDDSDGAGIQTTGLDYDFLVTTEQSDSNVINVSSGSFFQYIGTGTFDINASINQEINFGAMGGVSGAFSPLAANGRVEVEYNYTVPEPASALMICVVGTIALGIRRRFMA